MTKFTIGSQWETRNGGRAVVVGYDHDNEDGQTLLVWIEADEHGERCTENYSPDGRYFISPDMDESIYDLVRPWVEKKRGTFFINVYMADQPYAGGEFSTREAADKSAADVKRKRLACVEINWIEGQGLND